jgi:hypothetical protein
MSLSSSKQSSQSQLDPAFRDAYLANLESAKGVSGGLQAREFAGFTPDQLASFDITRQFADPNSQQMRQLGNAANIATRSGTYNPIDVYSRDVNASLANAARLNRGDIRDVSNVGVTGQQVTSEALGQIAPQARANIRDVNAGSFLNQNIQDYMNPYTKAVTEQGLTDLERARQLEQINTSAKATAARSFGGSRQGVAEAETNRAYGDTAQRFVRQQNADAYEAAQRASEADLARDMLSQQLNQAQDLATTSQSLELAGRFGLANQDANLRAQLANQGIDLSTGQLNTQLEQQTNLANQEARNRAAQFNASNFLQANLANQGAGLTANQQRISAGGLLSNIAGQGQKMGFAGADQLAAQGGMQQGFSQAQLDAIRNLPLEQQQILNQALGINVGGGSGMQSRSSGSSFGATFMTPGG